MYFITDFSGKTSTNLDLATTKASRINQEVILSEAKNQGKETHQQTIQSQEIFEINSDSETNPRTKRSCGYIVETKRTKKE